MVTTTTVRRWGLVALDQVFRNGTLVLTAGLVGVGIYARTQVQMPPLAGEWSAETLAQCQAAMKSALMRPGDQLFTLYTVNWAVLVMMATGDWRRAVRACAPLLVLWVGLGLVLWAW